MSDTIQTIDYKITPDGATVATLTIRFPDGSVQRFSASVDGAEIDRITSALAPEIGASKLRAALDKLPTDKRAEVEHRLRKQLGTFGFNIAMNPGQGVFDKIARGAVSIAKEIAGSKVFKLAASGLAVIAPALGPLAPLALGAAAGMGVASKLASATTAIKLGAKEAGAAIARSAHSDAHRISKGDPKKAAALLAVANVKRQKLHASATGKPYRPPPAQRPAPPAPRAELARPSTTRPPALLPALQAGRVHSNRPGPATRDELLRAAHANRIFWIA